jgi:hypothetical protein
MSTDLGVPMCAVCGGDRTSAASNGDLYCVDCNRIYRAFESHGSKELAFEPTDGLHNLRYIKRAA